MMKRRENETELKVIYGREKSFYKKAFTRFENGYLILRSYNTDVIAIKDGEVIRLWWDYSSTTMRHINEFLSQAGINQGGKKYWDSLPVQNIT